MKGRYSSSRLVVLRTKAAAETLKAKYYVSRRNVPMLIKTTGGVTYSICYFNRRSIWRVFWPFPSLAYPTVIPESQDFPSPSAIQQFWDSVESYKEQRKPFYSKSTVRYDRQNRTVLQVEAARQLKMRFDTE